MPPGAVLVYDVTDGESFEKVKTWVKELRKMVGTKICLSIVGNKCDRERERQVSAEEGARSFLSASVLLLIQLPCHLIHADPNSTTPTNRFHHSEYVTAQCGLDTNRHF